MKSNIINIFFYSFFFYRFWNYDYFIFNIPSQYYGTWTYSTGTKALELNKSSSSYSIEFYGTTGTHLDVGSTSFSGGDIGRGFVNVTKNSDTSRSWKDYIFLSVAPQLEL